MTPTEPTQEQVAVKGWMEKLKFEWMPFGMWKSPEGHPVQRNLSPEEATFFYRTCQAEVTKALDEVQANDNSQL